MVKTGEQESVQDFAPYAEKENLLKKFDIPIDHLDFGYIKKCKDGKEIEQIVQILRSGQEGIFPDLQKCAENRLTELKPNSKFLRTTVPVLSRKDLSKSEWDELTKDIEKWVIDIKKNDEELISFQNIKQNDNLPIRESKENKMKNNSNKTNRIKSMDYESWDKLDVDAEMLKQDLAEEKQKEESIKKRQEKINLNTVKLNPSIMSQTELKYTSEKARIDGNEAYKLGEYEDALQYYNNSIAYLPTVSVYNNRAITNIKLNKYEDALADCKQVLTREPCNTKALYRKATALKHLKKYHEAIEELEKLITLDPNDTTAQSLLKNIEAMAGINKREKFVRMKIVDHRSNSSTTSQNVTNNESSSSTNSICSDSKKMKIENEISNDATVVAKTVSSNSSLSDYTSISTTEINDRCFKSQNVTVTESSSSGCDKIATTTTTSSSTSLISNSCGGDADETKTICSNVLQNINPYEKIINEYNKTSPNCTTIPSNSGDAECGYPIENETTTPTTTTSNVSHCIVESNDNLNYHDSYNNLFENREPLLFKPRINKANNLFVSNYYDNGDDLLKSHEMKVVLIPIPGSSLKPGPHCIIKEVTNEYAERLEQNTRPMLGHKCSYFLDVTTLVEYIPEVPKMPLKLFGYNYSVVQTDAGLDLIDKGLIACMNTGDPDSTSPNMRTLDMLLQNPKEFRKFWLFMRSENSYQKLELLLKIIASTRYNLETVVGDKMDPEMFTQFLECLEYEFEEYSDTPVVEYFLMEFCKLYLMGGILPPFTKRDKKLLRKLLDRLLANGYSLSNEILILYQY